MEKKATAIPQVVASERGTAQTTCMYKPARIVQVGLWGTVRRERRIAGKLTIDGIAEEFWKVLPQKVIVL